MIVAINAVDIISLGFALPNILLRLIIPVGINVTPEVFNTKNVIIAGVAVSFLSFNSCKLSIAFNPKGVAADPNPTIFTIIFEAINPKDSCPSGIEGNSLFKTKENL